MRARPQPHPSLRGNGRRPGFTLVELLTVIAIIAVLAGLLFPVMASVRKNTEKSKCSTQMMSIVQGLKMYKDDWRVYPDALYGVSYAGGPVEPRLYPKYVKDEGTFICPSLPAQLKSQSTLVNPTNKAAGGPASSREAAPRTMSFPPWDSYDFQYVPKDPLGPPELRYNLKWTTGGLGLGDSPRQLIYRDPPETTVVTWCLYHADFDGAGVPKKGSMAQVLFLSGRVQQIPVDQLKAWSGTDGPWTVNPKP